MAQWAVARLTEHGLGEEIISHADLDKIIETLDFLRLHAGALEVHNAELRDWVRCGGGMAAILLDRYKGLMEKASGIRRANLEMICRELQEAVDMASKVCGVSFADCSYYVPISSIK